ncbi:hypothetical protein [Ancylobacter radicis]|uniref:Ferredoxin n=1 Tax=Ancylobacter radicis TaxID=2836179 RepID=A0ABS5R744_9HYPH|nr:hypothetical protein [Ancylobacter radicis]MBS9476202.1 hypothetical protein [Ancylobacter radicis]
MQSNGSGVVAARFRLHLRCEQCVTECKRILDVPRADDAPTDIEELLESAFLRRQNFICGVCESPIGVIAAVAKLRVPDLAQT